MPERKLVDIDQAQTYTAPNGAKYRLRPNSSGLVVDGGTTENPAEASAPSTDVVAMWKASEYDGSSQFLKDLSGNGHHLRFGSQFPAYIAKGALNLPNLVGNYASTPDSAALDISGDIDIRAKATLADWSPSAYSAFIGKTADGAGNWSYELGINNPTGTLALVWNTGTGSNLVAESTAAVSASDGSSLWVRGTLDVNDGSGNYVAKFYTSTDGVSWSQLGTTLTVPGTTSIATTTSPLWVGARNTGGGTSRLNGSVHYAEVRNGIDGDVVAKFDPSAVADFTTSFQSITGETWTIVQPGVRIDSVDGGMIVSGVVGASITDISSLPLNITGDIDIAVRFAADSWGGNGRLVTKNSATGTNRGWNFSLGSSRLAFAASMDGTTMGSDVLADTAFSGFVNGRPKWLRVTRNAANGQVRFYTAPDSTTYPAAWTQLGTTQTSGTGSMNISTTPTQIGSEGASFNGSTVNGKFYRAVVKSGIDGTAVLDVDFTAQKPYTASFTCTTGQMVYLNGQTGSDAGDPKYLPYSTGKYLYLPGTASNSASLANHPSVSIPGDLDVRIKLRLDDYTPSSNQSLVSKWSDAASSKSWIFGLTGAGLLRLAISIDGNASGTPTSSVPVPLTDGSTGWLRVTRVSASGTVKFYSSNDGLAWAQIGSDVAGTAGSLYSTTQPLMVGGRGDNVELLPGDVYRVVVKDGINGTTVYDADFTQADATQSTFSNGAFAVPANRSTFSRTSTAYLDGVEVASGTPRYAYGRNQLPTRTADFEDASHGWVNNIGTNSGAALSLVTDVVHQGASALKIQRNHTNTSQGAGFRATAIAGQTYVFSAWVYIGSLGSGVATTRVQSVLIFRDAAGASLSGVEGGNDPTDIRSSLLVGSWKRVEITLTAPTGTAYADVAVRFAGTHGVSDLVPWFVVDEAQLEIGSTASSWRAGGPSALLIEEGTTNLFTAAQSSFEDGSTGSWSANVGNPTLANSTAKAWTGTRSLLLTPTSAVTSNQLAYSASVAATADTAYTASLWIYSDIAITAAHLGINFQNGATYLGQSSATQTAVQAGIWTRLTHTATTVATTNQIALTLNGTFANAQGVYIDGIQLEAKTYPTSWQVGGGGRPDERFTIPMSGAWPAAGTAVFDVYLTKYQTNPASNARAIEFGNYTQANAFYVIPMTNGDLAFWVWKSDNTGWHYTQNIIGNAQVTAGWHQLAISWDTAASNYKIWWDGGTPVTVIGQGGLPAGNLNLAGHVLGWRFDYDGIRIYNKRLSDSEVTALWNSGRPAAPSATNDTLWLQDFRSTLDGQYSATTAINRSASGRKSVIVDRELMLFGGDDYLEAPHDTQLNAAQSDSLTLAVLVRLHGTQSGYGRFIEKRNDALGGTAAGYGLMAESTNRRPYFLFGDGTLNSQMFTTAIAASSSVSVMAAVRDVASDTLRAYLDGSSNTTTDATSASLANTLPLRIGRAGQGASNYADMEFIGAAIWKRALTDAELAYLAGEFGVDNA